MSALLYKAFFIIAFGEFDKDTQLWRPVAALSWRGATGWESHTIRDLVHTFDTKQEGETFAVETAKARVDEHLRQTRGSVDVRKLEGSMASEIDQQWLLKTNAQIQQGSEINVRQTTELLASVRETIQRSRDLRTASRLTVSTNASFLRKSLSHRGPATRSKDRITTN